MIAALLMRCAAWIFNDLMEARLFATVPKSWTVYGEPAPRRVLELLAILLAASLAAVAGLGIKALALAPIAFLIAAIYPFVKRLTTLGQLLLGCGYAWAIPMGVAAQGVWPDRAAWLLCVGVLLWATAHATLHALLHSVHEQRIGIRSLHQLLGDATPLAVALLQGMALSAWWIAAYSAELNIYYHLALFAILALFIYQQLLLRRRNNNLQRAAYHNNLWVGATLFVGIAFHFLCVCG